MATAREIIQRWPSRRALAADTGRRVTTVNSWYWRNVIPAGVYVAMVRAARRRGIALSYEELAMARHRHEAALFRAMRRGEKPLAERDFSGGRA